MGKKSSYEQLLEMKEKMGRLRVMAKDFVAELDDVCNALWAVACVSAGEDLARQAAENPPPQAPARVEAPPPEPPREMESVFDGKYWDDKAGKWLDEKPDVAAGPDGELELDIF